MRSRSRWIVIGVAVLCVAGLTAGLAVAFGGGDGGNSSTGSGASVQPTSGLTPSPSPDATAGPCPAGQSFAKGQVVCITDDGVEPRLLVAIVGNTITWRNETSEPQTVTFVAFDTHSGPIPPGGTWSYTPKLPLSLAYRVSTTERLGQIQVLEKS
jgi:hypothetical protein